MTARANRSSWPVPLQRRPTGGIGLPEDEQAWHATADALDEGLVVQDLSGAITLSNTAAHRILGISAEDMRGKGSLDSRWRTVYADGSERPGGEHPAMLVLQTGRPRWADVMGVHTPAGDLLWLSVNSVPVHDGYGELTGVVTAFADITALRVHEEHRLAGESRLHAAQELTGLAWWELDLRTGAHVWSEEMYRLVGLAPRDLPPDLDEYLELVHPADRPAAAALREQGYGSGHRETFRVIHPDHAVRFLQSWTDVQRDDAGTPVRILGATIDVTEREFALAQVASGRDKLAAALALNATAMWEWDIASGLLTWSDRMTELMGLDPSGTTPQVEDFLACVHPDYRSRIRELEERQVDDADVEPGDGEDVVHPASGVGVLRLGGHTA